MQILHPSMDEQIKIGGFFEAIDNTITLHQRQLDDLKFLPEIRKIRHDA